MTASFGISDDAVIGSGHKRDAIYKAIDELYDFINSSYVQKPNEKSIVCCGRFWSTSNLFSPVASLRG